MKAFIFFIGLILTAGACNAEDKCHWEIVPVGIYVPVNIAKLDGFEKANLVDGITLFKIPEGWEPLTVDHEWLNSRNKDKQSPWSTLWVKRKVCE